LVASERFGLHWILAVGFRVEYPQTTFMNLSLGFSPCPNDTFIFHALVHGAVEVNGLHFQERLEDVETLNRLARSASQAEERRSGHEALDVTKASYGAIPFLLDEYVLLRSGGALGRACGPLVVARDPVEMAQLRGKRIAIPGRFTTANLLLRLFDPLLPEAVEMVYSEIMPAVQRGQVDVGVIIHEGRFTYADYGLVALLDLGQWWEETTGYPIPLGGILARRSLGKDTIRAVDDAIRRSVEFAFDNPTASEAYVRRHAQEMDPEVVRQHIELYVNRFSAELGDEGEAAIRELFTRASDARVIPDAAQMRLFR
jgi:1,4-dihydroxy-6-naphthoate synthase